MTTTTWAGPEAGESGTEGLGRAIEHAIERSPNHDLLQRRLEGIRGTEELVCFLHRFLHFNDALAARVPFLAGLIHLHPELFADPADVEEFCRRRNACLSAYVAEAANDEYRMTAAGNLVHQRLSQLFFKAVLGHYALRGPDFDRAHPLPQSVAMLLDEARTLFFADARLETVCRAIGFHVGLEFYADQEFNLVDNFLRHQHEGLVAALSAKFDGEPAAYLWMSLHTVVEIGHYRAGLAAVADAVRFCVPRDMAPRVQEWILEGLAAFADLQRRFYECVLPG
ncbi:type IV secretory system conjugative DNA transfer family protein [Ramlibacter sp. G-1-2-2]|uniref:Type IV secretory system conjugative DNA transfer family protein n=1 Tax=Ramlibacter agri TaxID=2728837 RepID=A0A848H4Q1_9BURK|nr:hypothetical protein [Ramlibacter agri]NML44489.1 type IV secretory system conjugative DNA transfer family protein [Ramlibacter agri]